MEIKNQLLHLSNQDTQLLLSVWYFSIHHKKPRFQDFLLFDLSKGSKLWQAEIPPQHGAFVGVQSSCGALKCLDLKSKSETFSCVLAINSHTLRFAVTVSFRRKLLTLRQLSHGQIIYFYFADVSARTSSDTASTWCVCGKRSTGCTFFNS